MPEERRRRLEALNGWKWSASTKDLKEVMHGLGIKTSGPEKATPEQVREAVRRMAPEERAALRRQVLGNAANDDEPEEEPTIIGGPGLRR